MVGKTNEQYREEHGKVTRSDQVYRESESRISREGKAMNDLSLYENLVDAEEILGEVANLLEVEGKGDLLLARRARQVHERLKGWQERGTGGEISISKFQSANREWMNFGQSV